MLIIKSAIIGALVLGISGCDGEAGSQKEHARYESAIECYAVLSFVANSTEAVRQAEGGPRVGSQPNEMRNLAAQVMEQGVGLGSVINKTASAVRKEMLVRLISKMSQMDGLEVAEIRVYLVNTAQDAKSCVTKWSN